MHLFPDARILAPEGRKDAPRSISNFYGNRRVKRESQCDMQLGRSKSWRAVRRVRMCARSARLSYLVAIVGNSRWSRSAAVFSRRTVCRPKLHHTARQKELTLFFGGCPVLTFSILTAHTRTRTHVVGPTSLLYDPHSFRPHRCRRHHHRWYSQVALPG